MLQAAKNLRDVSVLTCAYHFKVKVCFMLHADNRFSRHMLISKLNQRMKRICFLRMGFLKHGYNLILILCMKQILVFTNELIETWVQPNPSFVHEIYFCRSDLLNQYVQFNSRCSHETDSFS